MSTYCPRCGAEAKEGAKFCTRCGYKFNIGFKPQSNLLKILVYIVLIIGVFIIPTIAVPVLIALTGVFLLKQKGRWYRINKLTRNVGITIATFVAIIIATSLFSNLGDQESLINISNSVKSSIDTEKFKKEFCENIGVDYSSEDWINENGTEMYFNGVGLSIGLIGENNALSGVIIMYDMKEASQGYALNGNLDLADEAFGWKCIALSLLTGEEISQISDKLRDFNLENEKLEEFDENIFVKASIENNLSLFTILIK